MSPNQLHIVQHSLGCDDFGMTKHKGDDEHDGCFGYSRNRFVTDPKCEDGIECGILAMFGLMKDHGPQSIAGGMHCYSVTELGIVQMQLESPKPPKVSRAQARYREFLDADCGMTFGEYLKWRHANRERIVALGGTP